MATNTDFNNLVGRINTATETLENNVNVLAQSSSDVTQAVTEAKTYASDAKQSETQATQQATKATTEATKAINAVEQAKALAPFQEAPKDGSIYGRKNGVWTLVENSGATGSLVKTVNNITPDASGNIAITIPTPVAQVNSDWNATSGKAQILNKPTLFSGSYSDLTNKPTIPTVPTKVSAFTNDSGYLEDAPIDTNQYVRQDGAWVISSGGGSGASTTGFPTTESWAYNNKTVSEWQTANPFEPVELAKVGAYADGEWLTSGQLITTSGIKTLPSGRYSFTTTDFTTAPLQGKRGYINIILAPTTADPYNKVAEIFVLDANETVVAQYKLESNDSFSIVSMSPKRVGYESWTASPNATTAGIKELFTGLMWKAAFGSRTILDYSNSLSAPSELPLGLYRFTNDTDIGGTSTSTPFLGRQGVIAVVEFLSAIGAERTGSVSNKLVVAMSWVGTTGTDLKFHVLTGNKTWITK